MSLKDNALPHINHKMILKLDIKDFFESITFMNVYNSVFKDYFPEKIGIILTYLCTYAEHLTQGSPTSAYISNLVMKNFDEVIGAWCENKDITYTRYSDDLTFSGNFNPSEVIKFVRKNLFKLSLELNDNKTHVITCSSQQNVTGIVVNKKIQTPKRYRKNIRQEIYYIKKYGIDSHIKRKNIKESKEKYLSILKGKINYVLQINNEDKEFLEYKKYMDNNK